MYSLQSVQWHFAKTERSDWPLVGLYSTTEGHQVANLDELRDEIVLLLSRVKHINLCKSRLLAWKREKTLHRVVKSTLNAKCIDSGRIHGIGNGSMDLGTQGRERHCIVVCRMWRSFSYSIIDIDSVYLSGGLTAVYMLWTQPSAVPWHCDQYRLLQCLMISVHSPLSRNTKATWNSSN